MVTDDHRRRFLERDGLEGFLIDPNGQPLDAQTTANDNLAPGLTMQFFHGSPAPGL